MDKLHQAAGFTVNKPEDPLLYIVNYPGQMPLLSWPIDTCRTQCAGAQQARAALQHCAISFQNCHVSQGLGSGVVVRVKMER